MTPSGKMTWAYAGAVVLGIALAGPGLGSVPCTQGDSVTYFMTARSVGLLLGWGWENGMAVVDGTADVAELRARYTREEVGFVLPYYSKPLFDLIYQAAMAIWGGMSQAILYANLVFFALAIWWMARVGELLFGGEVGLLAALLLATSGSGLVFARTGMAHMASLALFLLGAQLYLRLGQDLDPDGARRLGIPGAVWGICLAVHPNLLPYVGLCGLAELLRSWCARGRGAALQRAVWLVLGALAVGLAIEAAYRLAGLFFSNTFAAASAWQIVPFRTYFEQIAIHAAAVIDGEVTLLQKVYTYVLLFWAHEGLFVCALIGLATALCVRARGDAKTLLVVVLFWVPLLFFLLSRNQAVYRYAAGIVLPASLLAAIALERLLLFFRMRWPRSRPGALIGAVFTVVAVNFAHIRPIYAVESAWSTTAQWLRQHDQGRVVATSGGMLWAINGIENVDPRHGVEGVRYLALYRRYEKERERALLQRLGREVQPVFTAPHRRPDKLLEIEFLSSNFVLDGLEAMPGIGNFVASMRNKALKINKSHLMELYDLGSEDEALGGAMQGGSSCGSAEETKRFG